MSVDPNYGRPEWHRRREARCRASSALRADARATLTGPSRAGNNRALCLSHRCSPRHHSRRKPSANPVHAGARRRRRCAHRPGGFRASGTGGHADPARLRHGAAPTEVSQRFSDTFAYAGVKLQLVFSCYLIKHGDDYMLWDTGQPTTAPVPSRRRSAVVDQLAQVQGEARADQICRHQPLSWRPHRPGRLAAEIDAADRQGRLGRADQPEAGRRASIPSRSPAGSRAKARSSRCRWTRTCSATAP